MESEWLNVRRLIQPSVGGRMETDLLFPRPSVDVGELHLVQKSVLPYRLVWNDDKAARQTTDSR